MKTLRAHQVEGLAWCLEQQNPVLFWEQRTGKTLVAIRYGEAIGALRVLVIAPNSALGSWETQLEEEGQEFYRVSGTRERRRRILGNGKYGWFLVNKEGWQSVPEMWKYDWQLVVMDESASIIRYPGTKTTRYYLQEFQYEGRRMLLTGRPDPQNELLPYWPQMAWVNGGEWMGCSSFWQWRNRYFYQAGYEWKPRAGAKEKIDRAIMLGASVLLRKDTGRDVNKRVAIVPVNLTPTTREVYDRAEKDYVLELEGEEEKETKWEIVKFNWLRQITAGIYRSLFNEKLHELRKLDRYVLRGKKYVVVGCFTEEILAAREVYREGECEVLAGNVPAARRQEVVDRFNKGETRVLLCQVKVIDTGMDLHGAEAIVYLTVPLSVLSWVQSQDRILGDLTREEALVIVIEAEDTIDVAVRDSVTRADRESHGLLRRIREGIVAAAHRRSRRRDGVGLLGTRGTPGVGSAAGRTKGL